MAKDTSYVSDATKFLNEFIKKHPEAKVNQKQLRKTWWDTEGIDQEERKEYEDSKVKLGEYAYFSYPAKYRE